MQLIEQLRTPADHFRDAVLANMACLLAQLPHDTCKQLVEAMPMLGEYRKAARVTWCGSETAGPADWSHALSKLARSKPDWPIGKIMTSGFSPLHLHILLTLLMVEEDQTLADFVEPDGGFPSLGGLVSYWRLHGGSDNPAAVREALSDLVDAALAEPIETVSMRNEQRYRVPSPIAEMIAGMRPQLPGLAYVPRAPRADKTPWISPRPTCPQPEAVAAAVATGSSKRLLIRGPHHNGRKSFARRVAHAAGLSIVEIDPAIIANASQWRLATALAVLGNAALLCEADPGPGETVSLPIIAWGDPVTIIVSGLSGAVAAASGGAQLAITLPLPNREARAALWQAARLMHLETDLVPIILPSGNIKRAAKGAAAQAALGGRKKVEPADIQEALRSLRDARLDAVATRIDVDHDPDAIFLDSDTESEFDALVVRCRQRENLSEQDGSIGVRALLSGASGTGKTLAARHIARKLGKDLFRVDLSATVNKYIGETEKALERVLSAAEELDIVLLLDEGDALMAKRTDVGNSNDRYANLETNFLLQRVESFSGIILVTSNDAGRIDSAFARRMDAVLEFGAPDEVRRQDILTRLLGEEARVNPALLQEIACRCVLTGGQLRNVALHARLLALDASTGISDAQLRRAVEREYRKTNSPCPLRRALAAVG